MRESGSLVVDLIVLVIPGVAAVALLVLLALTLLPAFRARYGRSLARRLGLELDVTMAPRIERRLTLRTRLAALGGLIGLAAGTATALATDLGPTTGSWLINGGFFIGIGIGVSALAAARRPEPGAVRVARSREIALVDFVAPHELVPTRVLVMAAVLASLLWLLPLDAARQTTLFPAAPITAAIAVIAAIVFEVGGRAIIARPVPAETAGQLVWHDALRATAIRQLLTAPMTLALVSVIWSGFAALTVLPPTAGLIVLNISMPILVVALVVIAFLSVTSRPQRHFLRRLWPELATDAAR